MAASVHVSQLWQPEMRSDDLHSHRGTTRKSTHSSPLKGVHLLAKGSLFLSSFKIWNFILFILFLAIGLDELTCVMSFSQAHQDPYHDASVLFARHVKRRCPSFRQRSIEGCDGTTPRCPVPLVPDTCAGKNTTKLIQFLFWGWLGYLEINYFSLGW